MFAAPRAAEVCFSPFKRLAELTVSPGKARDGLYENVLAESEREAVADLLQYLENVRLSIFDTAIILHWNSAAKPISFLASRSAR